MGVHSSMTLQHKTQAGSALQKYVLRPCLQCRAGQHMKPLQLDRWARNGQAALQGTPGCRCRQGQTAFETTAFETPGHCSHVMRNPENMTWAAVICELFDAMLAPGSAAKKAKRSYFEAPCKICGRPTP